MLRIKKNPDEEMFKEVLAAVKANFGHCPCRLEYTLDTKCPCKEFRNQTTEGECNCGLYVKVQEDD